MELKMWLPCPNQLITQPCLEPWEFNTRRHVTCRYVYCNITLASNSASQRLLSASDLSTKRSLDIYRLPNITDVLTPPFLSLTLSKIWHLLLVHYHSKSSSSLFSENGSNRLLRNTYSLSSHWKLPQLITLYNGFLAVFLSMKYFPFLV